MWNELFFVFIACKAKFIRICVSKKRHFWCIFYEKLKHFLGFFIRTVFVWLLPQKIAKYSPHRPYAYYAYAHAVDIASLHNYIQWPSSQMGVSEYEIICCDMPIKWQIWESKKKSCACSQSAVYKSHLKDIVVASALWAIRMVCVPEREKN